MPPSQRVRITSSRASAARRADRRLSEEIEEQTGLGDVYLRGLMRAQLRLSLTVLGLGGLTLGLLPLLLTYVPSLRDARVGEVPLPWIVLGVLVYPVALVAARSYVRASERIERQFVEETEQAP
jgi:hypothetical protein